MKTRTYRTVQTLCGIFCAETLDKNPKLDYNMNPKSDYNTSHSGAQIKHRRFDVKNRRMIV